MEILFVKLSSMGDLIHALPALTDLQHIYPNAQVDWVIDKSFREVATWHPLVRNTIISAHRQWRKNIWQTFKNGEAISFLKQLRAKKYDYVIDGQNSAKSAVIMLLSKGQRHGMDKHSARDSMARFAYQQRYEIPKRAHAITRVRLLFSKIFNYEMPTTAADYGISHYPFPAVKFALPKPYLVFVHNASWNSKMWPERYWRELIKRTNQEGLHVLLPWGNAAEKARAEMLAQDHKKAIVLPFCSLSEMAFILKQSAGAICSDTGLAHLAAALAVPAVTLYGSTDEFLIGTVGLHQKHLVSSWPCQKCYQYECNYENKRHVEAQCLAAISSQQVWDALQSSDHKLRRL